MLTITLIHTMCLLANGLGLTVNSKIQQDNSWSNEIKPGKGSFSYHGVPQHDFFQDNHRRVNQRLPSNNRYGSDLDVEKYMDTMTKGECMEKNVSFYRSFYEVVNDITGGARINTKDSGECACTNGSFIFCSCSKLQLHEVPQNLSTKINGLDLSDNSIEILNFTSFQRYPKLKYVSLENNNLSRLSIDSFHGINELQALDLRRNDLTMTNGTYPVGIFKNLRSLVALRINKNTKDAEASDLFYPDKVLEDLKSLKYLSMDGIRNTTFGEGFEQLKHLQTLSLSGYLDGNCKLITLSNSMFQHLAQLKMLNVSDCFIEEENIETNTLKPLKNLHTIDFTWNEDMSLRKLAEIIGPLRNSELKELFVQRVEWRFSPGTTVNSWETLNLPRNLTCLVASGNSISRLDSGVLENLPDTLRYLDFSGNRLVFGQYLKHLYLLKNLEILILNGAEYTFRIPTKYPYITNEFNQRMLHPINQEIPTESEDNLLNDRGHLLLPLPPKLRVLKMEFAGLWYYLTELNISSDNSLEELYLSANYFPVITGPLRGLNKLKKLVMNNCQVITMHRKFFKHFPDLEKLDLYGNYIGTSNSLLHHPFSHLSNLTHLNISFNDVLNLKHDTFLGLSKLKELHITNNTVYKFNSDISNMNQLEILDLKTTSIGTLLPSIRNHIDALPNITVFMSGSPIDCVCDNLDFLNWMIRSKAIPKDKDYICVLKDRASIHINWSQFLTQVNIIKKECANNYGMFLIVLGVTLLLLVLVIGSVMYRFRWRLRYLYYGLHLWMTRRDVETEERKFVYDVFVSYANEDLNFVRRTVCSELHRRGLSTCIHSRDFRAGENITTNIIRAVRQSRRTLVVLTSHFVTSKWCRAEFQMAKEEALVSGRKTLVFLIADKIPKNKIGLELLNHIQQNTYIPYPGEVDNSPLDPCRDQGDEQPTCTKHMAMWDKLMADINS